MNMSASPVAGQFFQVEWHGDVLVVIPTPEVEALSDDLIDQAAPMVLGALRENPASGAIIDLTQVKFFGSVFISLLLRCHERTKANGIEMVIAGASKRIRELLRMTSLDTIWAIYDSRVEALEALVGID